VVALGQQFDDQRHCGVACGCVLDLVQQRLRDLCVELDEGALDESVQQLLVGRWLAPGRAQHRLGHLVVREVAEVVVVFEDFYDFWETAAFEAEGLEQHFVDGGAADEREVTEVVVVGLEQQRLLLDLFS
jgi:hypothetical protein